jgi:hypothetical protein
MLEFFYHASKRSAELVDWIKDVAQQWSLAGFRTLPDGAQQ